jgi:hypothetical protein
MDRELEIAKEEAAYDGFINMMSNLMVKYGPVVIEKKRNKTVRVLSELDVNQIVNASEKDKRLMLYAKKMKLLSMAG